MTDQELKYEAWLSDQIEASSGEVKDAYYLSREHLRDLRSAHEEISLALAELEQCYRLRPRVEDSTNTEAFSKCDLAHNRLQRAINRLLREALP